MVCVEIVLHMVPHVYQASPPWTRTVPTKLRATRKWLESKGVTDAVKRLVPVAGAQGASADIVQGVRFDSFTDAYEVCVRFFTDDRGDCSGGDHHHHRDTASRLMDFLGRFRSHMEDRVVRGRSFDMKLTCRSVSTPRFVPPIFV